MIQTVSFPGLGIENLSINRVAFTVFGHDIYWYGILIALAFLLAIGYALWRRKTFGLDGDRLLDVALGGIIGGIVGARLYYVIFSWGDYKDNLLDVFKLWNGGLAIYGGIIGGFLAGFLMCRLRKVPVLPMADVAVGGIILGQGIGRWGNFINVEAFGTVTDLPWRMSSPAVAAYLRQNDLVDAVTAGDIVNGTLGVHPTFLYESLWCLIGFVLLVLYTKHRRFDGELTLLYAIWYGAERSIVEGLRTDSLMWGSVRVSQALAIVLTVVGIIVWAAVRTKIKKSGNPDFLKLYVNTEEGQAVLAGTFYPTKDTEKKSDADEMPGTAETEDTGSAEADNENSGGTEEDVTTAGEDKSDESKTD